MDIARAREQAKADQGFLRGSILKEALQNQLDGVRSGVQDVAGQIISRGIRKLYLVGSGGSLAVALPVEMMVERYLGEYEVKGYDGEDFVIRRPERVSSDAAVVGISYTGTTEEIVSGIEWANKRGAYTIGIVGFEDTPMQEAVQANLVFDSRVVNISKMLLLYLLLGELLKPRNPGMAEKLVNSLEGMPSRLHEVKNEAIERFADVGRFLDREDAFCYVIGAGLTYGVAYNFTLCNLLEMLWMDGSLIHAGEFRHGPLEIATEDRSFVLFKGEEPSRTLVERAEGFISRYCRNIAVLDMLEFVNDEPWLSPFYLHVLAYAFSYNLAIRRAHSLDTRRYYGGKVEYPE